MVKVSRQDLRFKLVQNFVQYRKEILPLPSYNVMLNKQDADAFFAPQLTPFVTNQIQPMRGSYGSRKNQPISGHNYLAKWKKENGED